MLLGLVPILGGPTQALHWAMTAGILGVGALLALRHRARGREAALPPLGASAARPAGRTLLVICGIVGMMIAGIIASRVRAGGELSWLSVAMPLVGLLWVVSLGLKAARVGEPAAEPSRAEEAGSRVSRPRVAARSASRSTPPPRPQVSA